MNASVDLSYQEPLNAQFGAYVVFAFFPFFAVSCSVLTFIYVHRAKAAKKKQFIRELAEKKMEEEREGKSFAVRSFASSRKSVDVMGVNIKELIEAQDAETASLNAAAQQPVGSVRREDDSSAYPNAFADGGPAAASVSKWPGQPPQPLAQPPPQGQYTLQPTQQQQPVAQRPLVMPSKPQEAQFPPPPNATTFSSTFRSPQSPDASFSTRQFAEPQPEPHPASPSIPSLIDSRFPSPGSPGSPGAHVPPLPRDVVGDSSWSGPTVVRERQELAGSPVPVRSPRKHKREDADTAASITERIREWSSHQDQTQSVSRPQCVPFPRTR